MIYFDPRYFLYIAPAFLLALWAQMKVRTTYAEAQQQPAPLSGAAAARHILDSAGLQNVDIEMIPGQLSDHYDPRDKVLRLSEDVYQSRTLASVGIAAHEAGHALQDARAYAPLAIRNAAVPVANFGSGLGVVLMSIGLFLSARSPLGALLAMAGIALFGAVVFFQVVNLPVEFNASSRAKAQLAELGIVSPQVMPYVERVLSAAAWTYVAATLQAILTLLYFLVRLQGSRRE
jgi:uncharacterized protein